MCIIIDSCCFSSVFNSSNSDHNEFRPVLQWIVVGKGKLVYGGSKYREELRRASRYLFFFGQLTRAGKAVKIPSNIVDEIEVGVKAQECNPNFNDQHIVAIVIASKCRLICTKEEASVPFFKDSRFYPRGFRRPRIYKSSSNTSLLRDDNIVEICKPTTRGKRDLRLEFDF
jgi:hypothetical protein